MSYQKVIAKINENTYKCTDFYDFAEPFEVFERKLNVDVTPLLEEIDFYKGGRIIKYEYVPESSRFQKYLGSERESGIRRETHLVELFNNFKQGHICFVGPAGSGKSTLMKATSRDAMHGKYFQGTIKMVSYIQCKQFMKNRKVTAGELIFNDLPKEERGQAIDYAKTHPEEVLFMLDSLDTLQYTVDGVYEIISSDEPAYPEVIVWNFLTGKLFPGCRILSSSREHSIRNYWGEVRPDKVIALAGLTMESIKEIISGYEGNVEAEKIMEFLKIKAPLLLLLCTTPVMLVYTLIALKFESDFKPNTITGIMTVVMQSILRSSHTHQENIMEVLGKLKELSYIGTVEQRVLFTENDFRQVNLKPEDATDLAILAPGGIYRKLLQGIHLLYFQHQSIQEMLTSFYILGLNLKSFDQFVDKHLHTGHFVLIRKMMCGLLLNPTVYEAARDLLGDIKDLKEKRDILKKCLQLQLQKFRDESDLLELFTALNEAKDGMSDIVKSSLDNIDMFEHPLSISDAHVIGSVASYCTSLSMDFRKCDLKSASLQTLASGLKGSNVKIKDLRLAGNENMGVEGLSSVGQILSNQSCVRLLDIDNCNLSSDQLQAFKSSFGNNTEIKWLWLKGNTSMGVEGLSSVGQILSNRSCVEYLNLQECNLSPDQLQAFKSSLGNNTEV
uniref:NACHT, LRR and PYD domains-containing protein 3-like n=1 Tax=Styela clava TaxID=7725 RepID=UPI001939EA42|nr:NACHT, LRR and PYD domains-containing protein 3-like [Styela clava]